MIYTFNRPTYLKFNFRMRNNELFENNKKKLTASFDIAFFNCYTIRRGQTITPGGIIATVWVPAIIMTGVILEGLAWPLFTDLARNCSANESFISAPIVLVARQFVVICAKYALIKIFWTIIVPDMCLSVLFFILYSYGSLWRIDRELYLILFKTTSVL